MRLIRARWYDMGVVPAIVTLVCLIVFWGDMEMLRRLALMNFFVILWHQFEEYRFPGGEPAITNLAMQPKDIAHADRYPLNQNNAMFINVLAAYVIYLLPVAFPNILCLGFMPVLFGISQMIIHVVKTPKLIGNKVYSPGSLAVVFGHIPVGVYWLYYTISNRMLGILDIVLGIAYMLFFLGVVMLKIGYGVLSTPNSKYPFPEEEFERGGYAEKIRQLIDNNSGS